MTRRKKADIVVAMLLGIILFALVYAFLSTAEAENTGNIEIESERYACELAMMETNGTYTYNETRDKCVKQVNRSAG